MGFIYYIYVDPSFSRDKKLAFFCVRAKLASAAHREYSFRGLFRYYYYYWQTYVYIVRVCVDDVIKGGEECVGKL